MTVGGKQMVGGNFDHRARIRRRV